MQPVVATWCSLTALNLCWQVGLEPNKDALATEGIRFLTTIVNGVHCALFQVCAACDTALRSDVD